MTNWFFGLIVQALQTAWSLAVHHLGWAGIAVIGFGLLFGLSLATRVVRCLTSRRGLLCSGLLLAAALGVWYAGSSPSKSGESPEPTLASVEPATDEEEDLGSEIVESAPSSPPLVGFPPASAPTLRPAAIGSHSSPHSSPWQHPALHHPLAHEPVIHHSLAKVEPAAPQPVKTPVVLGTALPTRQAAVKVETAKPAKVEAPAPQPVKAPVVIVAESTPRPAAVKVEPVKPQPAKALAAAVADAEPAAPLQAGRNIPTEVASVETVEPAPAGPSAARAARAAAAQRRNQANWDAWMQLQMVSGQIDNAVMRSIPQQRGGPVSIGGGMGGAARGVHHAAPAHHRSY